MSKAKDDYYEFKAVSYEGFGGLSTDITNYIEELEDTIRKFEAMCYKCDKVETR